MPNCVRDGSPKGRDDSSARCGARQPGRLRRRRPSPLLPPHRLTAQHCLRQLKQKGRITPKLPPFGDPHHPDLRAMTEFRPDTKISTMNATHTARLDILLAAVTAIAASLRPDRALQAEKALRNAAHRIATKRQGPDADAAMACELSGLLAALNSAQRPTTPACGCQRVAHDVARGKRQATNTGTSSGAGTGTDTHAASHKVG